MNHEAVFSFANSAALLGWLLLIFSPRSRFTKTTVRSGLLSAVLSLSYFIIVMMALYSRSPGGFNSLAALRELFTNPDWLLAGWIHYLAFDLLVGTWLLQDSEENKIKHFILVPLLVATFMLGPAGYLMYRVLKKAVCGRPHVISDKKAEG